MKQTLRCPKCGHNRILYIAQVADSDGEGDDQPMRVALVSRHGPVGDVLRGTGELEAGVCRACGYTELYVKDPGAIPIDGQRVREIVGPEQPPYR